MGHRKFNIKFRTQNFPYCEVVCKYFVLLLVFVQEKFQFELS